MQYLRPEFEDYLRKTQKAFMFIWLVGIMLSFLAPALLFFTFRIRYISWLFHFDWTMLTYIISAVLVAGLVVFTRIRVEGAIPQLGFRRYPDWWEGKERELFQLLMRYFAGYLSIYFVLGLFEFLTIYLVLVQKDLTLAILSTVLMVPVKALFKPSIQGFILRRSKSLGLS